MRHNFSLLGLLAAILVTLAALIGHQYLPEKRFSVLPSGEGEPFYSLYSDSMEGGPSHSEWVGEEGSHHWRCRVEEPGSYHYCGLNIQFTHDEQSGLDLTGYHSVRLKLDQRSPKKGLSFFVRHYDPDYSDPADGNSAQFSQFSIRSQDLDDELLIHFSEFSLADWWVAERDLPRELMRPAFSNIILVGLGYRVSLPPGEYDVIIERVEFVGDWITRESWYLGILLAWLGGLFAWVVKRLLALHRAALRHRERERLLAEHNQQLREETNRYKEMSTRDPLTGAHNRFGLEQRLAELLSKDSARPLSLILLDIDFFKVFNDTYGHDMGDHVLRAIVYLLEQQTRGQDVVCRWGGEEFLLLCPETDLDNAALLAEKIREMVANTQLQPIVEIELTVSLGVGEMSAGESFAEAFARTDRALYEAKAWGRNCVMLAGAPTDPATKTQD